MTAQELRSHFNKVFGLNPWPDKYEVDPATYANCCQYVFNKRAVSLQLQDYMVKEIMLGPNNGLLFKNVELILKP